MKREATILVVDDEPDVREVLEEYFAAQGYATLAAESAARRAGERRGAAASTSRWWTSTCRGKTACRWRGTCASATPASRS